MRERSVYLAGPITGLYYTGANEWRAEVMKNLGDVGIKAYSPLRAKGYLKGIRGPLTDTPDVYKGLSVLSGDRGITTRDRFDATRCGVLLVNLLGAKTVSIGTVIELAWADSVRTPIVVAMEEEGNPHDHGMVRELVGYRVPSLEEAVDIVKAILTP